MNLRINQQIKLHNEEHEFLAFIDTISEKDISITIFDVSKVFSPGDRVIIEATGGDAVYFYTSTLIKLIYGSRNCSCVLSKPDISSRVQRRESIRISTRMPVLYQATEKVSAPEVGQILDISGTGVKLSSNARIHTGCILELSFQLVINHTSYPMKMCCKVVRELKSFSNYEYGLLFTNLNPVEQDKIVKYILYESVRKRSLSSYLAGR